MMFANLNASEYEYNDVFCNAEFENILSKVIACYNLMVSDKVKLSNNENSIRDVLLINYLNNNSIRKNIEMTDFLFDREVPEDKSTGRTDIKIQTLNTFQNTNAYYIIECKRLDAINPAGITGLNAKYIENGICRFTSKIYSTYNKTNGMIGFIVQTIDIHENIKSINSLLKNSFTQANMIGDLSNRSIVSGFDFSYFSLHTIDDEKISMYHLMFDFSKSIQ